MPPAQHARIIVCDSPSPWRTALVQRLEAANSAIRVSDNGQELRRSLEEVVDPPKLIVIGSPLQAIGGLEALFLADRNLFLEKKPRPSYPARTVSLITDVRSDAELLDVLRRRGVTQFIYREDPIDRTASTLLASLAPKLRSVVRMDALITIAQKKVQGAVYDLSPTGAQLVFPASEVAQIPAVGTMLEVEMVFRSQMLHCRAEVRRLTVRDGSAGKRLVLGVQMAALDESLNQTLERMIVDASEEYEMAHHP
jgi:hypothetical protein